MFPFGFCDFYQIGRKKYLLKLTRNNKNLLEKEKLKDKANNPSKPKD